ncbi:MAG TPA: discoidin domain-containing protein, partial [Saprospiraceae bacterium]|nr:discoidin domain-containing protein [Saprospiraceae bacterium]
IADGSCSTATAATVTFTPVIVPPVRTVVWNGPGAINVMGDTYSPSTATVGTQVYTVKSQCDGGDCVPCTSTACGTASTPSTVTVNVLPIPTVNTITSPMTYTSGSTVPSINFSGTPSGVVYNWTRTAGTIGLTPTSGTGSIPSFVANNLNAETVTSTFTVTPTYTENGVTCTGTPITFTLIVSDDKDGDGVLNCADLDDDNDGILDTQECPQTDLVTNGTFTGSAAGWTVGAAWSYGSNYMSGTGDNYTTPSALTQTIQTSNAQIDCNGYITLEFDLALGNVINNLNTTGTATLNVILGGTTYASFYNPPTANVTAGTLTVFNGAVISPTTAPITTTPTANFVHYILKIPANSVPSSSLLSFSMTSTTDDFYLDNVSMLTSTTLCDTDGDGVPNTVDLDSDNDGIPDAVEACSNIGVTLTNCMLTGTVLANGTISGSGCATLSNTDSATGDLIPNYLDLDSDGDGCSDSTEASSPSPANGSTFTVGPAGVDACGLVLSGGTSICNIPVNTNWINQCIAECLPDKDGDGVPNTLDLDDDNDGILDVVECGTAPLSLTSAVATQISDYGGYPASNAKDGNLSTFSSTAGNTTTDWWQIDLGAQYNLAELIVHPRTGVTYSMTNCYVMVSNTPFVGDNLATALANADYSYQLGTVSTDSPISIPASYTARYIRIQKSGTNGLNRNILDFDELMVNVMGTIDTDGDGVVNCMDLDSDNDGIPDAIEACGNINTTLNNMCGLDDTGKIYNINTSTGCSNGTFIGGLCTTLKDTDGDGIVDYKDLDSDGDGCADSFEASSPSPANGLTYTVGATGVDVCGLVVMGSDSICNVPINTNWIDICYAGCQPDKDGDNIPDSRDIDDDNDGISDSQELNCGPAASTATVTTTTGNAQVITGQYTYNGAVVNATTTFSSVNTAFMATSVVSGNGIHYLANDTGTDGTYSTTFTLTPANGNIGIDTIWFGPNLA